MRWARVAAGAGLALVAVVALAVGGTLTILRSDWGSDLVRRVAIPRLNDAIAGRVEVGRFKYGGDRVSLSDVVLRGPENDVVLRVREIAVRFAPLSLIRGHVAVSEARLVGPSLFLRRQGDTLNLLRAVAPKAPPSSPPGQPGRPERSASGPTIDVADLRVVDGELDVRLGEGAGHTGLGDVKATDIAVQGRGRFEPGPKAFEVNVNATASVRAPLPAPLAVHLTGQGRGDRLEAALRSTLGAAALEVTLHKDGSERVAARLSRAHVTPELVRAFLPGVKLRVPVDVRADVQRAGDALAFTANIDSAAGAVAVRGAGELAARRARELTISAVNLDLGGLIEGLPRSSLSLSVEGEGGGSSLRTLAGKLSVEMPVGRLEGVAIGPVEVRAEASPRRYQLTSLRLTLPGVRVEGHGDAGPEQLGLRLGIVADDLGRASRALAAFRELGLPALAGRGRVEVSVMGTVAAPDTRITAQLPRLVVGDDSVVGATVVAHIPNARRPDRGEADLRVARARVGGRALRKVEVHARSSARRLALTARVGGALPLSLTVAGSWGEARQSFALERFALRYPGATWTLVRPARLSFRPERVQIEGLELSAQAQRLRVDWEQRGDSVHGAFAVDGLDLAALPLALLRPGLSLAGRLDAHATLEGTMGRPRAEGTVVLRGGAYRHYRDLSLNLQGRYARERVAGTLAAAGLGTTVDARFDLPTQWPLRDRQAPLSLDLTVPPVDLAALAEAAKIPLVRPIKGRVGLSLALHGTADAPDARLDASATGLVVDGYPLGAVTLSVAGSPTTPLGLALAVRGGDGSGRATAAAKGPAEALICAGSLQLRTDLTLAALSKRLPTARELGRARFEVSGDLRGIPLGGLSRLLGSPVLSGGAASVRISAAGTPLSPSGALNVQVAGATGPRFPPTDGRLDATFGAQDVRVALNVARGSKELASASAILGISARALGDRAALGAAPLVLKAAVGPLRIQRGDLEGSLLTGPPTPLSARLKAALSVDGTLNRPSLKMDVALDGAHLGKAPLGSGRARVTYAARRANLDIELRSVKGEAVRVQGATEVDLGYPQVTKSIDVAALPLAATLTAREFDLAWLSGLSDSVQVIGGALSASLTASGKIGQPQVKGRLEWTRGVLGLTGLGNYRDVHLLAHGDRNALWLDDLRLVSGDGWARATAKATRTGTGYQLESALKLHRFPVYGQGQVLAVLSATSNLVGAGSHERAKVDVKLSDVHAELTDAKQKDLQPLGRPPDVILMNGGKPLDRAEARKLAAVQALMSDEPARPGSGGSSPARSSDDAPFELQVGVDAPRDLWVRGKDASLELGLGPDFRIESTDRLRIYGRVDVRRGRIDLLGRRLDVQAGSSLRFTGAPDAPRLDVKAKYFNETEHITVVLTAKGALDELTIAVTSPERPDLTEGQLYTLIVTGRLQLGGNTAGSVSASSQAASLVGGLVASQLQKTLAKRLPLDVLTLQAGEGLTGSRLEAGTYLTSKLYAGYVGRVGANPALLQNRNAVHLEYQLSRRWSFDGEYGDVGTGTADLMWTKHY